MIPLLTSAEMGELDARTIREAGVPGAVLMETAGRGVFRALWDRFAERARAGAVVVCGRGNNGGDGFVVARCLLNRGVPVRALLLGDRDRVSPDARVHLEAYLGSGGTLTQVGADGAGLDAAVSGASLVVDAILGTGLRSDVRGVAAQAIEAVNRAKGLVVSVDIPSGVDADTGRICGRAVRADLTVTFAWPKRGHFLHPGAAVRGDLVVVDIGIPPGFLNPGEQTLRLLEGADLAGRIVRPPDAHKGTLGHVWVGGGSPGKTGAPGLAALGALRAGAGLVTVAHPGALPVAARLPLEVMTAPLGPESDWTAAAWGALPSEAAKAGAWVVGPGMGVSEGARAFLGRVLEQPVPVVLDADALNLLAAGSESLWSGAGPRVLTPHPGEAGRLLGVPVPQVQADRVGAARELARRFGCAVILKGAGTLVTAPGEAVWLVPTGNPGMATAGTGDVLAGVVGALLARGLCGLEAALAGAWIHGLAGDLAAARRGGEGMTAGDLVEALPDAMKRMADPPPAADLGGAEFPSPVEVP